MKDIHKDCRWTISDDGPTENPLESISCTISSSAKDMSIDKRSAWIYGIVLGWDDPSYKELQAKHQWTAEDISRNKRLHQKYIQCWNYINP